MGTERHKQIDTMVLENLEECLFTAEYCIQYRKRNDSNLWHPPHALVGCLGHPAFILLMTNIDALGGLLGKKKNNTLKVNLNGEKEPFKYCSSGWERFKVLNTEYFDFNLDDSVIKDLYKFGRNVMIHNASLGRDIQLFPTEGAPPIQVNPIQGKGRIKVYLPTLLKSSKLAVTKFSEDYKAIVAGSISGPDFKYKGPPKKGA